MSENLTEFFDEQDEDDNVRLREQLARAKNELSKERAALRVAVAERDAAVARLDTVGRVEAGSGRPPTWARPRKRKGDTHHATPVLMLSDLHFGEVVDPEQVDWINAYDRKIAEQRLHRTVEKVCELSTDYFTGLTYDGIVVLLGGDMFSGIIHPELRETNEAPVLRELHHWEPLMAGALERLAGQFGKLHVVCTYGNHGRTLDKPRMKHRAGENYEWYWYQAVAKSVRSDHVSWQVPDAADVLWSVYDHRYLLTHGDQFRGGSGIAGALSPLLLGTHRKTRRQMAVGKPYDVMWVGHWHQYMSLPGKGLIVNGSMKGYDEYAYLNNFEPEPAQQAFCLVTPEHGVTFSAPIVCVDRKAEGW